MADAKDKDSSNGSKEDSDFTRKFGELVARMVRAGKSQSDIAAALGRYQSRVSKWKLGVGEPTPADLANIVRFFNVTYDYLCDEAVTDPLGVSTFSPAPRPGEPLTDGERAILKVVRRLGEEAALDRLIAAPGDVPYRAGEPRRAKD